MAPPTDPALAELKAKYVQRGIVRAASAKNVPQLLDTIVRFKLYTSPGWDYRAAMEDAFAQDSELKEAYARS